MSIKELRAQRDAMAREMRALVDGNPGKSWDKDVHGQQYDNLLAQIEAIDADIRRQQQIAELSAEKDVPIVVAGGERSALSVAVNSWLRTGDMDGGIRAQIAQKIHPSITNDMSTAPASGGVTVPTQIMPQVLDRLQAYGGMRQAAEVFSTDSGAPISYPTSDGTTEEGEIIGEGQPASKLDTTFGAVSLGVYKYSSKVIAVSYELLQDSAVDVEALLVKRIGTRIGRIQNRHFTSGTGVSQPMGVVTAAQVGVVAATGGVSSVTYDNLVDLYHSVDPAYRTGDDKWMFNDSTLAALRKLKDNDGRPIFIPGYYDNGIAGGVPDTLLGRPFIINQQMDSLGANNKPVAYGDFTYYKIRDAMAVSLFRFADSAYTVNGQVGFLAWCRSGGNLVDIGGAVKTFQNSAT